MFNLVDFTIETEAGIKSYPYIYETHLHTTAGSACAHNTGQEMAKALKDFGYAGMIVTEHNWGGNTCVPQGSSWETYVKALAGGYEEAKAYGDVNNFDVFFGYEAGFDATEFLIYGLSPEWLLAHPEMKEITVEEQFSLVHSGGGMVVHAHPFREEPYIPEIRLFPEYVDGVETVNATHSSHRSGYHNDPNFDKRAVEYATKYHLPMTGGSDIHSTYLFGGGVACKQRLSSIQDYMKVIKEGDYLMTNGDAIFDSRGNWLKDITT